ncbi:1144_t:CDS:2 [Paraglomus occultum]|uniref:1144_t:CDS:1 n=1 Tax=Paraglomus occultum TaxID=144539 RepID=A0A9N9GQM7_9GLOM|nr:1144_t:CDS:2 [Paraglomus occultum]
MPRRRQIINKVRESPRSQPIVDMPRRRQIINKVCESPRSQPTRAMAFEPQVIDSDNEASSYLDTWQSPPLSEPENQNPVITEADSDENSQEILERGDREIAEWVASRPEILKLVMDLTRNDKKQDDAYVDQSDRIYKESRALFLRTRNSTPELYEEFAARILKSTRAHPSVAAVAKKIGEVTTYDELNDKNLYEFVDDYVWRDVLHLPLMGVSEMLLNNNKEMTSKLREFVVRAVEKWVVGNESKKAISV